MAIDKNVRLPQRFREQYSHHIAVRLAGSVLLIAAACGLCTALDFSGIRYPAMAVALVIACGFALACLIFRPHTILFRKSWSGTVTEIVPSYKYKPGHRGVATRKFVVTLMIDTGEAKPRQFELLHEDRNGENKYFTEAPYKVGDTVVFLRGLRYPMRYGVEIDGMLDVRFVCPYCGEINKAAREACLRCGKILTK